MFNQFMKDFFTFLAVEKKIAHRKEILVSRQMSEEVKVYFNFIVKDSSPGKTLLHNLMKTLISTNQNFFEMMNKINLLKLCSTYGLPAKQKEVKLVLMNRLQNAISNSHTMPFWEKLKTETEPTASSSTCTITSNEPPESGEICIVCLKLEGHKDWIQCVKCQHWIHRNCAGLSHYKKWKVTSKQNPNFNCKQCQ